MLAQLETLAAERIAGLQASPVNPFEEQCFDRLVCEILAEADREGWTSFQARLRKKPGLMAWVVETYLSSRLGALHKHYFEVRESADAQQLSGLFKALDDLFLTLGENRFFRAYLYLRPLRQAPLQFGFDPFRDLRRSLALHRRGGLWRALSWSVFQVAQMRVWTIAILCRLYFSYLARTGWPQKRGRAGLSRNMTNFGWTLAHLLMPGVTKALSGPQVRAALSIPGRIPERLLQIISRVFKGDQPVGAAKLAKVAAGVWLAREAAFDPSKVAEPQSYLEDTVLMSIAWGLSYPLVDDSLDTVGVPDEAKAGIASTVNLFAQGAWEELYSVALRDDRTAASDIAYCFALLQQRLKSETLTRFQAWISVLGEVHVRDAVRQIRPAPEVGEVLVDSMLKAALVRIATLELCGNEVDDQEISAQLTAGLYNQVGDDICDLWEDLAANQATSVTLEYCDLSTVSVGGLYRRLTVQMMEGAAEPAKKALVHAALETLRILRQQSSGEPYTARLCEAVLGRTLLEKAGPTLDRLPYLEIDSFLFGLFNSVAQSYKTK